MRKLFLALLLFVLLLPACNEGAATLTELGAVVAEGFKQKSMKEMGQALPAQKTVEQFNEAYKYDPSVSKTAREKLATDQYRNLMNALKNQFDSTLAAGETGGINWGNIQYQDTRYTQREEVEGYQVAEVQVIMRHADSTITVRLNAVQVEERWYVWEKMTLKK